MIKAVLFDMGGVVSGNLDKIRYTELSKLVRGGLSWENVEKSIKLYEQRFEKGLISSEEFWKLVGKTLKIKNYNKIEKVYIDRITKRGKANKTVLWVAKELKKKGYKIGILSNTNKIDANIHKKRGDYNLFSPVIPSHEVNCRKPEKKMYLIALRRLKVKPEECIFIDDKKRNINPARTLGIKTILFESTSQLKRELNRLL